MCKIAGTEGPIEPLKHYPAIMERIKKEAEERYELDI